MDPTDCFICFCPLGIKRLTNYNQNVESDNERDCLLHEPILPFVPGNLG